MRNLILATLFSLSGCSAALIERTSTLSYDGEKTATKPYVEEHVAGEPTHTGVLKRLLIHNPLPVAIQAEVTCTSMFNDDPSEHVKARSTRIIFVNGSSTWKQGCFLAGYTELE